MVNYIQGPVDGAVVERTYSTEEAASRLGISKSTILRWFRQVASRKFDVIGTGWRVFTAKDLAAIRKKVG
jgi:excisionase family DNA binding protein